MLLMILNSYVRFVCFLVITLIVRENLCNKAKNVKKSRFWIKKNVKNVKPVKVMTCKVLETTQSVFCPVSVSINY